jgi:hypothetical protein
VARSHRSPVVKVTGYVNVASGIAPGEGIEGRKGDAMFRHACAMGLEGMV